MNDEEAPQDRPSVGGEPVAGYWVLAGAVSLFAFFFFGGPSLVSCSRPTAPGLIAPALPLAPRLDGFAISYGRPSLQYGQALTIPIQVVNHSGVSVASLTLECALYDKSGALIDSGWVFIDNVAAGATVTSSALFMKPTGARIRCRASDAL